MASKKLFTSSKPKTNKYLYRHDSMDYNPPKANTRNASGGRAYSVTKEHELAQYVCTAFLSNAAEADKIIELSKQCNPEFVARLAVYARQQGKMKDTPALLLATLAAQGELFWLGMSFNLVIDNVKMLRNFVQIIQSGKTGRKSMGSAVRNMVRGWLASKTDEQLFRQSVGTSPSLADVVKMVHPRPKNKERETFFGWLLGKKYNKRYLNPLIKEYEAFKKNPSSDVPAVPFRMLTFLPLTTEQWSQIALQSGWDMVRQNLNTFERHEVFNNKDVVNQLIRKIVNPKQIRKYNNFPYQLLTAYRYTLGNVDMEVSNALEMATETATENIPNFENYSSIWKGIAVCVDVSGSMQDPITGSREAVGGVTSKMRRVDGAALIASIIMRRNEHTTIVPFDVSFRSDINIYKNKRIMETAERLSVKGRATDCSSALAHLNNINYHGMLIVFLSDNESWYNDNPNLLQARWGMGKATKMAMEWQKFKTRNPWAKMVCIDLAANSSVQVVDSGSVLNICGWSDAMWGTVERFVSGEATDFVSEINKVRLAGTITDKCEEENSEDSN